MEMETEDGEYIDATSKLGKLIVEVNRIEKKPALDDALSEILNKFLDALSKSNDYLRNGIFQLNFAEAALLLQSSAFVYSKKVDLLWDAINECQKRMLAFKSDENNLELKRLEEREQKYKRKRKVIEVSQNKDKSHKVDNFHIDWNDVSEFQHMRCEKDPNIFSGWHKKMIVNWDLQPANKTTILAEKFSHFRGLENSICDKDQDDDFVVHTSKMESVIVLDNLILQQKPKCHDFSFAVYSQSYLIPKFLGNKGYAYDELGKHVEELKQFINSYRDEYCFSNALKSITSDSRQTPQKLRRVSVCSNFVPKLLDCQVNLERLSIDKLGRLSKMSHCTAPIEDYNHENSTKGDSSLLRADSDCGVVATALPDLIDLEEIENSPVIVPEGPLMDRSSQEEHMDCCLPEHSGCLVDKQDVFIKVVYEKQTLNPQFIEKYRDVPMISMIQGMSRKRKVEELNGDDVEGQTRKKRRLSKAALQKLATGITVDLKKFNAFFVANYKPEYGEGQVDIPEFEFDDPIDSSSVIDKDERICLTRQSEHIFSSQDSGYVTRNDISLLETSSEIPSQPTEVATQISDSPENGRSQDGDLVITNNICETPGASSQLLTTSNQSEQENACTPGDKPLYQKVYEWKQHMSEKFKNMKSMDFDIHEYGSAIMENLEDDRPKKFSEIVQGKTSAEVTRYFISALQLANTYNIDIQGAQSGRLSNETFALKLITRDHCYDRLKDYVAPSEEIHQERLKCVLGNRKKNSDAIPSTSGCTNYKRRKF